MSEPETLKQHLRSGQAAIGCWLHTPSADAAEILSSCGFDFLLIDHEHGPGSLTDAIAQMRAVKAIGGPPVILRVPGHDPVYVKRVLDSGATGIMFPNVESAAAAKAAVAACKFPPAGIRGAAGIVRAAGYGADPGYFARADEEILVICQIETATAVEHIAEIAAVPGVDCLFIGPRDLSGSIGKGGLYDDPEVKALLQKAAERILKSGCLLGSIAPNVAATKAMLARGYRLILPAGDVTLLREGALAMTAALKSDR